MYILKFIHVYIYTYINRAALGMTQQMQGQMQASPGGAQLNREEMRRERAPPRPAQKRTVADIFKVLHCALQCVLQGDAVCVAYDVCRDCAPPRSAQKRSFADTSTVLQCILQCVLQSDAVCVACDVRRERAPPRPAQKKKCCRHLQGVAACVLQCVLHFVLQCVLQCCRATQCVLHMTCGGNTCRHACPKENCCQRFQGIAVCVLLCVLLCVLQCVLQCVWQCVLESVIAYFASDVRRERAPPRRAPK